MTYHADMTRLFVPTQVAVGNQFKRGLRITCSRCPTTFVERFNTMAGNDSGDEHLMRFVHRKFTNAGWKVGDTRRQHLCPDCVEKARRAKEKTMAADTPNLNVVKPAPLATVPPPREMSREDRRLIFAKLEGVYEDEKTGYQKDWTDKRVADDLGCPQAWVAKIRDENFGPHGSNPTIDSELAEARRHIAEARKLGQALLDAADGMERRLIIIQKAVRP